MSWFQRVIQYVVNEVIVDRLANSRTFQRFAIRTSEMLQQARKQLEEGSKDVGAHTKDWRAAATKYTQVFRDEVTKGMKEINEKLNEKPPGGPGKK